MASTYVIQDGKKFLQLEDGSLAPVMAPLSLEGGSVVALTEGQENLLDQIITLVTSLTQSGGTNWEKLQSAPDLAQSFTYLSAGTADERVQTVTYSSTTLGISIVETYTYGGSEGNYRVTGITRAAA
jgi:hypothetical protein